MRKKEDILNRIKTLNIDNLYLYDLYNKTEGSETPEKQDILNRQESNRNVIKDLIWVLEDSVFTPLKNEEQLKLIRDDFNNTVAIGTKLKMITNKGEMITVTLNQRATCLHKNNVYVGLSELDGLHEIDYLIWK